MHLTVLQLTSCFMVCGIGHCDLLRYRSKYSCHLTLPTRLNIKWRHSHPLMSADILRRRDVSPKVAEKFRELFAAGHSPASALESHKQDLQLVDSDSYAAKVADRFHCPDLQWCYRLYYKLVKTEYGALSDLQDGDGHPTITATETLLTDTALNQQLSTSSVTETEESADKVAEVRIELTQILDTLSDKLQQDPATYLGAVKAFVRNFNNIKSTSALLSAMHCFGTATAGRKRKAVVSQSHSQKTKNKEG